MKNLLIGFLTLVSTLFASSVFSNQKDVKVYDCFLFFNELDILEIRLNELYDVVDYFVIVENSLTHSGKQKPLYYVENQKRFAKFQDKIIHIIGPKIEKAKDAWVRENAQRNDILLGLNEAKDNDVVLITDVDEIIKREKVQEIKDFVAKGKEPMRLGLKMYRYFINRRDMEVNIWRLAVAGSYKTVKELKPQFLRTDLKSEFTVDDAGWHFTSLGWMKNYVYKLESWAHQERNKANNKDSYRVLKKARKGKLVRIDKSYPKFIVENIDYFKKRNYIDDNYPMNWNIRVFNKRQKLLDKQKI